jgi:peptidoglycan/LPS O-acetylase OafA/YrhL
LKPNPRIALIDYLRLAASVCVCISHVLGALRDTHHILNPMNEVFGLTIVFRVPLLFAISGFVVQRSIRNKPQTFLSVCHFLGRRWVWILIPLCLALTFTYCYEKLLWVNGFPHVPQRTPIDVISNMLCLTSFTNTRRWIDPTWSLAYELQYYLITALVWISTSSRTARQETGLHVQIAVLTLLLISLVLHSQFQVEGFGTWHFRWFALGLLAAMRFSHIKYVWVFRLGILNVGFASIMEGEVILVTTKLLLLFGILMYIETGGLRSVDQLLRTSPILGTVSYLIYLFHWPIASHSGALVHFCRLIGLHDDYWPMFAILFPIGISVLIAKPVYRLCEWATNLLAKKKRCRSRIVAEP